MRNKLFTLTLALALTLVLAGCTPNNTASVTYTDSNGSQSTLEGDANDNGSKSSNWPSHIPTPNGASNFSYAKLDQTYYLSFDMAGSSDVSGTVTSVSSGLESAGWGAQSDSTLETDDAVIKSFKRQGDSMLMTVSKEDGKVVVAIIAGPDQN